MNLFLCLNCWLLGQQDAYKLPHRLIEKKRRDRINECIGQLKDLLPEHLKLSVSCHQIDAFRECYEKSEMGNSLLFSPRHSGIWRKLLSWS